MAEDIESFIPQIEALVAQMKANELHFDLTDAKYALSERFLARYGLSDCQWTERVELARQQLAERGEDADLSAVLARHEMEKLHLALRHRAELAVFESRDKDVN